MSAVPVSFNGNEVYVQVVEKPGFYRVGFDLDEWRGLRLAVGQRVALQGNMDPCLLYASPERIRAEVAAILDSYGPGTGHVFNLGHGIHPDVPPEHAAALVTAVHELSRPYHKG